MKKRVLTSLLVLCFAFGLAPKVFAASEIEGNDTFETAQSISTNTTMNGNLATSSDVDYYKVNLNSAGHVSITLNHEYAEYNWQEWKVTLYNGDKKEMVTYTFGGHSTKNTCNPIGVPAGTYYAKVFPSGCPSTPYEFRINYTSSNTWEKEFNDTFATANQISVNTTVNGSLMASTDTDYYKVNLSSASNISITFNHEYAEYNWQEWKVTLYNGDNKELATYTFGGHSTKNTCNPIGVPAGTYYAKVFPSGGPSTPYELRINYTSSNAWEKEFNDTFATANQISVNTTVSGSLMTSTDTDYYKVNLSSASNISITFNHEYAEYNWQEWKVTLYNGDNKELVTYTFGGHSTKNTCDPIGVSAGTYYAKVFPSGCPSVKYEIMLSTNSTSFRDVASNAYYATAVSWAVGKSITTGTSATTFSPNNPCSRAEVVTFLWRAKGSLNPRSSRNPFRDISSSSWYYKAVLWAVEQGIAQGTSTTTFSPNATCTRGEVVTFLHRTEGRPSPSTWYNPFRDVSSSNYYYTATLWAVQKSITNGTSATAFSPNKTCTRAEVVTFLHRDLVK